MITRFYADNYKCLQNFEYKPNQLELIVGANGTGKTTVFEALDKVRRFLMGKEDARELFSTECCTRWSYSPQQIFEVDLEISNNTIQYRLEINLAASRRVEKEQIKRNGLLISETGWAKIANTGDAMSDDPDEDPFDDHADEVRVVNQGENSERGRRTLSDPNKSFLSSVYGIAGLRESIASTHFLKLNPSLMTSRVGKVEPRPAKDLANFASYYLYLLQQKQGKMFEMIPHLREAIPDFDSFAVEEDFEAGRRELRVVCRAASKRNSASTVKYGFEEMSDGQRALIALYTLLFCTLDSNSTLIIDEPENYIALRELQPWLMLLQERLEEHGGQVILISHHPEFINALAPSRTTVFEREIGGPVRVKPFNTEMAKTLSPAEVVARGWENE